MHKPHSVQLPQQLSFFSSDMVFGSFYGTDNPRQLRVLEALLHGAVLREELDSIAGCSNGPDLIDQLRCRGLEVPCKRLSRTDRDGRPCRPGEYSLSENDRILVIKWFAEQSTSNPNSAIH